MPKEEIFRFKKFIVSHNVNAQKVCTDSVLLGAWAEISNAAKILDIGTGCGVLSLMVAQRNHFSEITAVETDKLFFQEALQNFSVSDFSNRIQAIHSDILKSSFGKFDYIICNPPYFNEDVKSENKERNQARHQTNLDFFSLGKYCSEHLKEEGRAGFVISGLKKEILISEFSKSGLFLQRITSVSHQPDDKPSLILIEFGLKQNHIMENSFSIREDSEYSEAYKELLKDFLIIF